MFVSLWSLKGGSGCSVVAALTALQRSNSNDSATLLLDLGGELSTVLGSPPPAGPGLAEWLRTGADGPPDGLARLATEVAPGVGLVGPGLVDIPVGDPSEVLLRQIDAFPGTVVVDAGRVLGASPRTGVARWLAARATRSVLVTRACYLSLSRARHSFGGRRGPRTGPGADLFGRLPSGRRAGRCRDLLRPGHCAGCGRRAPSG